MSDSSLLKEIKYAVGHSGQTLIFGAEVTKHVVGYRQIQLRQCEAGGQLFATFEDGNVIVQRAIGPRASDRRSRFSFVPNRLAERREIKHLFRSGLHYVGEWHTHPTPIPRPSGVDLRSMSDTFVKSRHELAGFVLLIVGTVAPPRGLCVAVCDGERCVELPVSSTYSSARTEPD